MTGWPGIGAPTQNQSLSKFKLSNRCWRELRKLARIKFPGNEYLFRRVNIFDHEDLLHEFISAWWFKIQDNDEPLIKKDFRQFIIKQIDKAKRLHASSEEQTFTDFMQPADEYDVVEPEEFTQQDAIDAKLNELGAYSPRIPIKQYLHDGSYRDPDTGEIDYDLMLRDMVLVMQEKSLYLNWQLSLLNTEAETQAFRNLVDAYHRLPQFEKLATFKLLLSKMARETQQELAKRIGVHQASISRYQKRLFTPLKTALKKK